MQEMSNIEKNYKTWIKDLKENYLRQRQKAILCVNSSLIEFYWNLGKDIYNKAENIYGSGFYIQLSRDLQNEIPNTKGFSERNLKYAKVFYEFYAVDANRQQAVADFDPTPLFSIPWGHNIQIISKCAQNKEKALFFVHKTIENNWSRSLLLNFLDTDLFERSGKAITNFSKTLPQLQGELAQQMTKDPYNFDFLTLTEAYKEKDLEDALISNITNFLLELGTGFSFMGRQYKIVSSRIKNNFADN